LAPLARERGVIRRAGLAMAYGGWNGATIAPKEKPGRESRVVQRLKTALGNVAGYKRRPCWMD